MQDMGDPEMMSDDLPNHLMTAGYNHSNFWVFNGFGTHRSLMPRCLKKVELGQTSVTPLRWGIWEEERNGLQRSILDFQSKKFAAQRQ